MPWPNRLHQSLKARPQLAHYQHPQHRQAHPRLCLGQPRQQRRRRLRCHNHPGRRLNPPRLRPRLVPRQVPRRLRQKPVNQQNPLQSQPHRCRPLQLQRQRHRRRARRPRVPRLKELHPRPLNAPNLQDRRLPAKPTCRRSQAFLQQKARHQPGRPPHRAQGHLHRCP